MKFPDLSRLFKPKPSNRVQRTPSMASFMGGFTGVMNALERYYKAAKVERTALDWTTNVSHINQITQTSHRTIVARTRHQFANNGFVRRIVAQAEQNIIGEAGVCLQSKHPVEAIRTALETAWDDWGEIETCEVTGQYSWIDLQLAVVRSVELNGEAFLIKVKNRSLNDYGFSLQIIDPQRIPSALLLEANERGNKVINGVEVNAYGKPVAYYLTQKDDQFNAYNQHGGKQSYDRIPAEDCIHIFEADYIGAKRGFPRLASVLPSLYQMEQFEDAAVVNARVGACTSLLLQQSAEMEAPHTPADYEKDENGNIIYPDPKEPTPPTLTPGSSNFLDPGVTATTFDPTYPNNEFGPFRKALLQTVAVGVGCNYSNLASDGNATNFSTMRSFSLIDQDGHMMRQRFIINHLCKLVFKAWLKEALKNGAIAVNGRALGLTQINELKNVAWQARRWPWIDPLKDTVAKTQALQNMTTSVSQVIREQGKDPDDVFREIAGDLKRFADYGIPPELVGKIYGITTSDNGLTEKLLLDTQQDEALVNDNPPTPTNKK